MRKRLNDSEMSLFASVKCEMPFDAPVKESCGRGSGDATQSTYGRNLRQCRYTVLTRQFGIGLARSFRAFIGDMSISKYHSATVDVLTHADGKGLGFLDLRFNKSDGTTVSMALSQSDARNLAQMLNAGANSCNTMWRKSSLTL